MNWNAEATQPLTDDERKALAARAKEKRARHDAEQRARWDAAARHANEIWEAAQPASEHPYLRRKGIEACGTRVADWVKTHVNQVTGEVIELRIQNALLIPLRNEKKQIRSLQAIFSEKNTKLQRDKDFLSNGEKTGCWFTIGKPLQHDGKPLIFICEWLATGSSIHAATGHGVVVAFDAGNLLPVTATVRRIMPDSTIIVAADNDAWTESPLKNPGVHYAQRAAAASRAVAVIPKFVNPDPKNTDWNDLASVEGIDEARAQLMAPLAAPAPPKQESIPLVAVALPEPDRETVLDDDPHDSSTFFRVLGHDETNIHIYCFEKNMTESHPPEKWGKGSMMAVAPLEWWENEFKGTKSASERWETAAHNWIIRMAYRRG
jgi:putative DNA primase/helicase